MSIEYECRCCYESFQDRKDVISPCKCLGSMKYICKQCFNEQREILDQGKCRTCNFSYEYGEDEKAIRTKKNMLSQNNRDYWANILFYVLIAIFVFAVFYKCLNEENSTTIVYVVICIVWLSIIGIDAFVGLDDDVFVLMVVLVYAIVYCIDKGYDYSIALYLFVIFISVILGLYIFKETSESESYVDNLNSPLIVENYKELPVMDQELMKYQNSY